MRAYERLLRYVVIHTTSDENSTTTPSSARQFELAKLLVQEMKKLGIEDACVNEKCYVYGSLPATEGFENATRLGLIAHMDTSPDCSGENVKPQIIANYDGKDITLPSGRVLDTINFPHLPGLKGRTLITSDGTTLLGADDKAGIAEIMTALERIQTERIPHGYKNKGRGYTPPPSMLPSNGCACDASEMNRSDSDRGSRRNDFNLSLVCAVSVLDKSRVDPDYKRFTSCNGKLKVGDTLYTFGFLEGDSAIGRSSVCNQKCQSVVCTIAVDFKSVCRRSSGTHREFGEFVQRSINDRNTLNSHLFHPFLMHGS